VVYIEDILEMIGSYGFPMVIAVYLLVRMEPLIRSLQKSVDTLTLVISLQSNYKPNDLKDLKVALKNQFDDD
jgi:hypothetical protein